MLSSFVYLVFLQKLYASKINNGYDHIIKSKQGGFKKVDNGRIDKISNTVTNAFEKMADGFVEKFLTGEGESVEEAKARLAKEQYERAEKEYLK